LLIHVPGSENRTNFYFRSNEGGLSHDEEWSC
jgi:hypothetical protein